MSQDYPLIWKRQVGWGGVSGDLQSGSNSVSLVDGVSDMVPAALSVGEGFRKRTMASTHLDARNFTLFLYTTGAFQAATSVLEFRGSESE